MPEKAGLRAKMRAVVHNGIPQPETPIRRIPRPAAAAPRFLMLSRLTIEKGVRVLLDAVAQLPPDLVFEVAIAGTGPLEDEVRAATARDRRITYLGFVDGEAKAKALSWADHLLLPSLWYENAPVTIIEAAAHGIGLIGSDIGAIPEFVENGQTGLLFPPGDAAALAAIMWRVAQDPSVLPNLAVRGRALAERFTLERMITQYERHYLDLLDRLPASAAA
jgi:glycosyltransferase involved in cell wall biosynthesis